MKNLRGSLFSFVNQFEQRVFAEGKAAINLIDSKGLGAESFYQTTKGIYGYFSKYSAQNLPGRTIG